MKVAKKTEYGLRAMVALATLAGENQAVPLRSIAESENIPEPFLDQIVAKLRKAGFVKSVRGVNGGYMLSRPASDIRIGALVRVLEGSLSPIDCVSEENPNSTQLCGKVRACQTRTVWLRVMEAITASLDSLSLEDVIQNDVPLSVMGLSQ